MSRTIRRKNTYTIKHYIFNNSDLDENNVVDVFYPKKFNGFSLEEANVKSKAYYHACKGRSWQFTPGKDYRQLYRAKSNHQLRVQILRGEDYEGTSVLKRCFNCD